MEREAQLRLQHALAPVLALTLEQVKAHLDRCVERQRA